MADAHLKSLSNNALNDKVKVLFRQEGNLTRMVVEHIAEVDRRKLHLAMAYPSLFEYLRREIGYSQGAAQRRIDAARLLNQVPAIGEKIGSGAVNLGQISKLQKICRLKRRAGTPVAFAKQLAILSKIQNKGNEQTDLILSREFNLEIKTEEKKQIQRDESVRVELTFSKDEMEFLKKAQEILSNKTGGALKATIVELARKLVTNSEVLRTKKRGDNPSDRNVSATVAVKKVLVKSRTDEPKPVKNLKSVTPRLKREILNRDQFCQYVDRDTGRLCGSKHFLEIDHIQPRFAGGGQRPTNLRVLCRNHNQYRYLAEDGPHTF